MNHNWNETIDMLRNQQVLLSITASMFGLFAITVALYLLVRTLQKRVERLEHRSDAMLPPVDSPTRNQGPGASQPKGSNSYGSRTAITLSGALAQVP